MENYKSINEFVKQKISDHNDTYPALFKIRFSEDELNFISSIISDFSHQKLTEVIDIIPDQKTIVEAMIVDKLKDLLTQLEKK